MTMSPQTATLRIANQLCDSEESLDRTLACSAALLATMAQARIDVASPFAEGHHAIMRMVRSLNALTDARGELARAHGALRKVGEERGDVAPFEECPGGLREAALLEPVGLAA